MPDECQSIWMGLMALSLALLLSICINVVCYFYRQKGISQRDSSRETYRTQSSTSVLENGGYHYQGDVQELRENPIYGNVNKEREFTGPQDKTAMTHRREGNKSSGSHMSYASLDLRVTKRAKAAPGVQPEPTADLLARLPQPPDSQDSLLPSGVGSDSPVASHSSIYLNSQQIALENEERYPWRLAGPPARCSGADWPADGGSSGGWVREEEVDGDKESWC